MIETWLSHDKSLSDFRSGIRSSIRGLWLGSLTTFGFIDGLRATIERGLRQAWREGAATCGISEDELTDKEISRREQLINSQFTFMFNFADDIEANSKASGGKLQPLFNRGEMWINRYNEARELAASLACGDEKVMWRVGPTEHCNTCKGFNGRVYRRSTWEENGALPRTWNLECRGRFCQCGLFPTTQRITPGRFPRGLLL